MDLFTLLQVLAKSEWSSHHVSANLKNHATPPAPLFTIVISEWSLIRQNIAADANVVIFHLPSNTPSAGHKISGRQTGLQSNKIILYMLLELHSTSI